MKRTLVAAGLCLLVHVLVVGCGPTLVPPTATPVPPTATAVPPTATATSTPLPTNTPTSTPTATVTPTPTPAHSALLLEETFDQDHLGWQPQQGMDTIADGKLWLSGPGATPQEWTGYLVSPTMKVSIAGDATFEVKLAFEHGPHFSGPYFLVSEGYLAVMLGEERGLGLLRPNYQAKQYDDLGRVPRSSDGSVMLKIVFVRDKMTVWANDNLIASRRAAIFAEPKRFGGFYVGEEDRLVIDRLVFWTEPEIAARVAPSLTPSPTPTPAPVILITQKTDGYDCNPAKCGAEPSGYVLGGSKASLLEIEEGWAYVELFGAPGYEGPKARIWISADSYKPYTEADRCFEVPPRTEARNTGTREFQGQLVSEFGPLGVVAFWPPSPLGDWGCVQNHWSVVGRIVEVQGTEGDRVLTVSVGDEIPNKKFMVRGYIVLWLQEPNAPVGMPVSEFLKPIYRAPLDCVFQPGDFVDIWFEGPTAGNSKAEVTELVKSTAEFTAVGLKGIR